ncbi:MAG TPA: PASTA domain-containing protein, partial [Gaiellaceae bacterium]|nr:PASTA domain-containing protein [Gaiellaceae bacterium]
MTEAGSIVGTAQYLSPEQARGTAVDQRSDLYSLGIVLYELVTGELPFNGDTPVEIAMKHLSQTPPPPSTLRPELPHDLDLVVTRALAKDPEDRYQSAEEMDADLERLARGAAISAETEESATQIMRAPTGPMSATAATMIVPPRRGAGAYAPVPPLPSPVYYDLEEPIHRRPIWPWIAALLFVIGAGVGGWFLYNQISNKLASNKVVPVQLYQGMRQDLARAKITADGFTPIPRYVPNKTTPNGVVFQQRPNAGDHRAKGDPVTIWISTGVPRVAVPTLVGMQSTDAVAALKDAKFVVKIRQVPSSLPAGQVTAQDPPAGTKEPEGSTVWINVSKGPTPVSVPNVIGQPIATASSLLQSQHLKVSPTFVDSNQPANTVVDQNPKPGVSVGEGSVVSLTVSNGPKTSTVPDVTSLDLGTAQQTLHDSGFRPQVIYQNTSDPNSDGVVLAETPVGGTQLKPGSSVTLTVGRLVVGTTTTTTT